MTMIKQQNSQSNPQMQTHLLSYAAINKCDKNDINNYHFNQKFWKSIWNHNRVRVEKDNDVPKGDKFKCNISYSILTFSTKNKPKWFYLAKQMTTD